MNLPIQLDRLPLHGVRRKDCDHGHEFAVCECFWLTDGSKAIDEIGCPVCHVDQIPDGISHLTVDGKLLLVCQNCHEEICGGEVPHATPTVNRSYSQVDAEQRLRVKIR